MYLEYFWLSVVGIFFSGMLSMLGIIIGVGAFKKKNRPAVPFGRGFDPRNPINQNSVLNQLNKEACSNTGWYEVTGNWDNGLYSVVSHEKHCY